MVVKTIHDHHDDLCIMQSIVYGVGRLMRRSHYCSSSVAATPRVIVAHHHNATSVMAFLDEEGDEEEEDITQGKDAVHWSRVALALKAENKVQRDRLRALEQDMAALKEAHSLLQDQHATANRELTAAQADAPVPPVPAAAMMMPVNTQGRDAVYWHNMCRTFQAQFMESRRELELKTEQFVVVLAARNHQ